MQTPQYIGVYSLRNKLQEGPRTLYFVWQTETDEYIVQRIDSARQPTGAPERIARDMLLRNFVPEAPPTPRAVAPQDGALSPSSPAARPETQETESASLVSPPGSTGGEEEALFSDMEFRRLELARKAKHLEAALRETFRKTLLRLKRPKERSAALAALEQLAAAEEGIVVEHRHMFRDFGVQLRKHAHPETALHFSHRVVKLAPGDDHALFNMARVLYDLRKFDEAEQLLEKAMKMNAAEPAHRLLRDSIMREKRRAPRTRR